ncbi:MAG: carboxypeptidase regulatory-like domain-containing protein [Planctomycetes bacterium]|nr:carboxypeptidase regulatory-like domain-containing protein [Planctomycetota bacterium]
MNRSVATPAVGVGLAAALGVVLLGLGARPGGTSRGTAPMAGIESAAARVAQPLAATVMPADEGGSGARAAERAPVARESGASFVLGTVVDPEERPIAGARAMLFDGALYGSSARAPRELFDATSDELGRYRFAVPTSDGPFAVRVSAAGFAAKSGNPFKLTAPGVHVHDIELGERLRYETLVLDAFSRRPIAGARLGAASPHGERLLATSDANGRLSCEVQGPAGESYVTEAAFGSVSMSVRADGYLVS